MTNSVNQLAVTPTQRDAIMRHSLSRRSVDEISDANDLICAIRAEVKSETYRRAYNSDERKKLTEILQAKAIGMRMRGQAFNVAVRCLYVAFCDDPKLGTPVPKMLATLDAWEGKIWRLPGHVVLGVDRCTDRIDAEFKRRQANALKRKNASRKRKV